MWKLLYLKVIRKIHLRLSFFHIHLIDSIYVYKTLFTDLLKIFNILCYLSSL